MLMLQISSMEAKLMDIIWISNLMATWPYFLQHLFPGRKSIGNAMGAIEERFAVPIVDKENFLQSPILFVTFSMMFA